MFSIGGWSLSGLTFLPLCPAPMYIDLLRGALSKTHKTALTLGGEPCACVCVWGGVVLVVGRAGLSSPSPLSMLLPPARPFWSGMRCLIWARPCPSVSPTQALKVCILRSPSTHVPLASSTASALSPIRHPPPLALLLPTAQRCVQVIVVHVRCGWGSAGPLPLVAPAPPHSSRG